MATIINTPANWGNELFVVNSQCGYSCNILYIQEGEETPKIYHKKRDKTILVLQGSIQLTLESSTKVLNKGETYHFAPKIIHRFMAVKGEATILEIGTKMEENDSVVIEK